MTAEARANAMPAWLLVVPAMLVVAMHAVRLGNAPMAGTEPHRVLVAKQMASGESSWLVPTLFGKPYLRKPPLHYWVMASVDRAVGGAGVTTLRLVSVIEAALTALVVSLFAARWFSRTAGLVAGCAFVVAVALWSQSRSADIDALNTLLATLCGCLLVELQLHGRGDGESRRPRVALGAMLTLCFAGMLLAKGPAGLPVVVGGLLGPAIATRNWKLPLRSTLLVPLLLGGLLFVGYVILAKVALARSGLPPDTSGLSEAAQWMTPDLARLGKASLIVPQLFGYALPLSVFVVLAFVPGLSRAARDARHDRFSSALAWTVLAGWLACFATLMVNPRYGNVIVPMLCPLVGGLVARMIESGQGRNGVGVVLGSSAFAAACGAVALTVARWSDDPGRLPTATAAGSCVLVAIVTLASLRQRRLAASAATTVLTFMLLSVPVNAHDDHRARLRSGRSVADQLRGAITDDRPVIAGQVVFAQPELFHYAGIAPRWVAEQLLDDRDVPADCWLVLDDTELAWWQANHGERLGPVQSFRTYRKAIHVLRLASGQRD